MSALENEDDLMDLESSFIALTIRSLSGIEMPFPQISLFVGVDELKQIIANENSDFPVSSQRLIKYNLKSGDTVYVVKKLDAIDDDGDGDDGLGPIVRVTNSVDSNQITVVVPNGARGGSRLLINPPGREQMSVLVPAGLRSGDRFQVRLPPLNNANRNDRIRIGGNNDGQIMQVTCPELSFGLL
ncbi:Hypothetical Protein FCC1311_056882 [Hondaea fermentalgiana]|uniref:Ubiquitin-like domain-containing protein n=1 Tax=Hondaea fermentalgiana TaxID=2315210 RepID=A0A2R5GEY1_9STRA|nr:Hypothetical Protein FCC1311_056882 [Hondaea fermentalgiana]|eukprot:GBG29467.1 Hypothetical Protein FCC1311_056882 [Hondaea fermentalgiana]